MPITVASFAKDVTDEYGEDISAKFVARFDSPDEEILFTRALNALDEVLLGSCTPIVPSLGRTSPCRCDGEFRFP